MAPESVIVMDSVCKHFGATKAVEGLSLRVSAGGVFGLLGPNGAGKTTTLRVLLDILTPDEGSIRLFGAPSPTPGQSARIGYLPEERGLYRAMRVIDQLVFLGEVKGMSRARGRALALDWLERLGLEDRATAKIRELSRGMQQKIQFVGAVMHGPELLVLDEPFSGLDAIGADHLSRLVAELARNGATVIFSTHIMEQAESICDRVCILAAGRKLLEGSVDQIKREYGRKKVRLLVAEDCRRRVAAILAGSDGVDTVEQPGDWLEVVPVEGKNGAEIVSMLVAAGIRIDEFETSCDSLREIFLGLVRGTNEGLSGV